MSEQAALDEFEREKWRSEYELRKREVELKERDASRSRWSSPVVLALLAAAIAGLGNAAAIWLNGRQASDLEETKAEAARILEVIRTDNPDKAAVNLKFLVDAGLISNDARRADIQKFLDGRAAGQGPSLSSSRQVRELPTRPALPEEFKMSSQEFEEFIRNMSPRELEEFTQKLLGTLPTMPTMPKMSLEQLMELTKKWPIKPEQPQKDQP
jgi:hypothetical protein